MSSPISHVPLQGQKGPAEGDLICWCARKKISARRETRASSGVSVGCRRAAAVRLSRGLLQQEITGGKRKAVCARRGWIF
jgi:hypothetical protein